MFLYKMVFFQCDHPGCMGVLRATAQKQEQQRMATLEILQVRIDDLCTKHMPTNNKNSYHTGVNISQITTI